MPRIRTIKPEFWTDSKTGNLSGDATKLFMGILNHCDDYGVIPFDITEMKAKIFPYSAIPAEELIKPLLECEILPMGLAVVFANIREGSRGFGRLFLYVMNFEKHQKVDHPGRPQIPGWKTGENPYTLNLKIAANVPGNKHNARESSRIFASPRAVREGKGKERKGLEGKVGEGSGEGENGDKPPPVPHEGALSRENQRQQTKDYGPAQKLRRVMLHGKIAHGVDIDDEAWDRAHWPEFEPLAKKILEECGGDAQAAGVRMSREVSAIIAKRVKI